MLYRTYGKTGLRMPVLTFGAMRIPFNEEKTPHSEWLPKERNAVETIRKALSLGINHIDTARAYDNSERLVGIALNELGRDSFIVTTKALAVQSRADAEKSIKDSLRALSVDRIDILDLHGINTIETLHRCLAPDGSLAAALEARKNGQISHIAFSSHGGPDVIIPALETGYFSAVSLLYWWTNQRNAEAFQRAKELGVGTLALSAAEKGGLLFKPTPQLSEVCEPYTPLELTHKWLLDQGVSTITVGASNPDEFEAHLPALDDNGELTPGQREALGRWTEKEKQSLGADLCTICYKCMPCPENVNIPEILRLRNLGKTFDMIEFGQMRYNLLENAGDWFPGRKADKCTNCGKCLPKCPRRLAIPDLLRNTHSMLISAPKSRLWA